MKKHAFILLLAATFAGCETETGTPATAPAIQGTFILNNGNWGDNDSNIGIYNINEGTYVPDVFFAANGERLGDLAQDMVVVGDKVIIAVYGSQNIVMTDLSLNVISRINITHEKRILSPRHLITFRGFVYITFYEGFVGKFNPEDGSLYIIETGQNPEGMAVAGDYLYVANSGGMNYPDYDNTLSIISLDSLEEIGSIEVNTNPVKIEAISDGTAVYIFSYGNYASIPPQLQVIDSSGKISDLEYSSVSDIAKSRDDILFILCAGYDEQWNPLPGKVFIHDMKKNISLGEFIIDDTKLPGAYSISCAEDGYIYIGCSDYKNTGEMYVFDSNGRLQNRFDTQGLNPILAY